MKSHGTGKRTLEEEIEGIRLFLDNATVDAEKGKVYWVTPNPNARKIKPSDEAGTLMKSGYTKIVHEGKQYLRHRIIFYAVHGYLPLLVDHKKGVECGDGIDNLQEITHITNQQKRKKQKNNTTGYRGVTYHKKSNKYQAALWIDGKYTYLGSFDTPEEASECYKMKARVVHGEYYNESL